MSRRLKNHDSVLGENWKMTKSAGKEKVKNMETRIFWCRLELIKKRFKGSFLRREVTAIVWYELMER